MPDLTCQAQDVAWVLKDAHSALSPCTTIPKPSQLQRRSVSSVGIIRGANRGIQACLELSEDPHLQLPLPWPVAPYYQNFGGQEYARQFNIWARMVHLRFDDSMRVKDCPSNTS